MTLNIFISRVSFALFIILALDLSWTRVTTTSKENAFSNQWAVLIKGGKEVADRVAREHGFKNMGRVSFS